MIKIVNLLKQNFILPKFLKKNLGGFTLIETLVAIFVLTVGIVAVLLMFPLSIQVGKSAQMATIAVQLGQGEVEEIVSKSYGEILVGTTSKTTFDSPFSSYQKEIKISYVDPNNNLQETGSDTGIKKIEITIFWEPPLLGSTKTLKIASLIAEK